jgi:hypothetical protein
MTTVLRPLREDDFQQQVIELARVYGWRVAHFRAAQTARGWRTPVEADGAGFPDLVLVRAPEIIFAELKSARGTVSTDQRDWIAALSLVEEGIAQRTGAPPEDRLVEVNVWRPADFDTIHARLARERPTIRSAA